MDSIVTEIPSAPLEDVLMALQPDTLRPLRGDELYHLERVLRMAWRLMTPAQRSCFASSAEVAALLRAKGGQARRVGATIGAGGHQGVAPAAAAIALADGKAERVPPLFRLVS